MKRFHSSLIKNTLILAFAFMSFACSVLADGCNLAVPQLVGGIGSESSEGNGYWEPGWLPLTGEKPCHEEQKGRGVRYKKATTRLSVTLKNLLGEWNSWKFIHQYEAHADHYTRTSSHWSNFDGKWFGPSSMDHSYSFGWESMFQRSEAEWAEGEWNLNESRSSATIPYWEMHPEHFGSGTDYILSGAFAITIVNPTTTTNVHYSSEKFLDGRWRSTTITGRISTCPGKYKIILYYTETPGGGIKSIEDEKEFSAPMPPDGYPVSMPLPTTECARTEYVRMEYVAVASCSDTPPPPGSGGPSNKSVMSITHLGRKHDGGSAGSLYLHRPAVAADVFSPASLEYLDPAGSGADSVIRDASGALRQLRMPEFLVDITPVTVPSTPDAVVSGYQIAFYPLSMVEDQVDPVTGFYPLKTQAIPSYTKRHDNPDAPLVSNASATKLRITSQHAGGGAQVDLFENVAGGVSLSLANGLKRVVKTTSVSGSDLVTTEQLFSPAGATVPDLVSSTVTRSFSFGKRVIEESRGTGAARVWTSYTYDDTSSSGTYGLLKLKQSSDGSWERYDYYSNRDLRYTWSPLEDAGSSTTDPTLLKCVEQVKTSVTAHPVYGDGDLLTTIELQGGVEVARSHKFTSATPETIFIGSDDTVGALVKREIESKATTPGGSQAWDAAGNILTHTYFPLAGEDTHEFLRQDRPDGTITLVRHSGNTTSGSSVMEKWEGKPNAEKTDLVDGVRTATERTGTNLLVSETVRDVATEVGGVRNSGSVISEQQYSNHDIVGRPKTVVYLDGSTETRDYSTCCGKLTLRSRNGVTTNYGYDALGRLEWEMVSAGDPPSPTILSEIRYTYNADDRLRTRERRAYSNGAAGALQPIERSVYDDAGTLLSTSTPGSLATDPTLTRVTTYGSSYDPATGRTTRTVTRPGGATEVTIVRRSGDVYSRTGTGAFPVRYENGTATLSDAAEWDISTSTPVPYAKEIKLSAAGADTPETTTTYSDFLGRPIKTVYGDGAASRSFYNAKGQLVRRTDPDGVQTLYTYNELGERLLAVLDYNRNGTNSIPGIDLGGTDRITRTTTVVGTRDTIPVRRTTVEAWLTDGTDSATPLSTSEVSLDGLQSWQTSYGQVTYTLIAHNAATGTRTETTTHPDLTQTIRIYQADRLVSETRMDNGSPRTAIAETLYGYDAHGRVQVVSNLQASGSALPAPDSPLATTYTYYADDQVASVRTPDPDLTRSGTGYDAQLTSYHYDAAGRVDDVTQPDNTHTYTTYWPTGQVKRTWGTKVYPSEYAYDAQGRVKTLTTWKDFASSAGAALTTWNYHPQRGWLSSKVYAGDVSGPSYTYWPSGRLNTRVWARGITTTYTYNNAGDLWTVVYSGDAAPTVTTVYDRLGRQKTITDAAGALTRTYDRGLLDDESYVGGLLAGRTLTRALDTNTGAVTVARPGTLGVTALNTLTYGYDNAGRLQTITEASGSVATLGYKPLVGALQSVTLATAGTTRLVSNRVIDQLGRVASVDFDNPAPGLLASRVYTYNGANQRVQVEHEDTRRWAYGYDALGQVNLAEKRQSNSSVLPGYAFAFDYDDIGNRETATANGRVSNYASDALNRYLARGTPLWADVRGKALSTASVLVNDELAIRTGEDFYSAVPVGGLKENALKIQAARPSPEQAVTENRTVLVPAVPENFAYDADGNLTQDGLWNYQWDGENRLKVQELRPDVANATWRRIQYAYDGQGRRIQKLVTTAPSPGGPPTTTSDTRFLYDGWNLVAEYSYSGATFTLVRSHAWGLDLSGSAQGAGGVGGLLWTKVAATGKIYAAGSDANGNVVVYVDCADGAVAGRRDYGAFGEAVMTTGVAGSLPFGFSTKFEEKETGLYYYGFRYYNTQTGRWISRDPIEEEGGLNLYGMVENDPINDIDPDGLVKFKVTRTKVAGGDASLHGQYGWTEFPVDKTNHKFQFYYKNCECRDKNKLEYKFEVSSARARRNSHVGGARITWGGASAIAAHEEKRVRVWRHFYTGMYGLIEKEYNSLRGKGATEAECRKDWDEKHRQLIERANALVARYMNLAIQAQAKIGQETPITGVFDGELRMVGVDNLQDISADLVSVTW